MTPSIQSFPSALRMALTIVVGGGGVILYLMTPRSKAEVVASSASPLGSWIIIVDNSVPIFQTGTLRLERQVTVSLG